MTLKRYLFVAVALGLLPAPGEAQQDPQLIGEGARVYAANCGRCHNARSSTERTDAEWALIVAHMRARANFTRAEARAVLAYLQATNLPEGAGEDVASAPAPKVLSPELLAFLRADAKESRPIMGSPPGPSRG